MEREAKGKKEGREGNRVMVGMDWRGRMKRRMRALLLRNGKQVGRG